MFVKEYLIVNIITINLFLPHSSISSTLELCPIYLYVPSIQSRAWQMVATQIYILIENLLDKELNEKQGWREKTMLFFSVWLEMVFLLRVLLSDSQLLPLNL